MAQIFVSYARADRELVAPLIAALQGQGWSVWWDPAINPGQEFDQLISAELDAAKAAIVVWTPTSVESRWVRGEAREAASRGVLVPVRFGNARLPLDVRTLHTTDLDAWRGSSTSAAFQELARALRAMLDGPGEPRPISPPALAQPVVTPAFKRRRLILGGAGLLLLIGMLGFFGFKEGSFHHSTSNAANTGSGEVAAGAPNPAAVRVVVLPFDVLSDSPATHHFAEGLTDEIVSTLSTNQMQTVSRDDGVALRGPGRDEALAKLNAGLLFDGTVEERSADIHVRVHIDSTNDHGILWSGDFTGAATEPQTLQTAVATEVAGLIQMAIFAKSPGTTSIDNETLSMTLKVVDGLRYAHDQDQQLGLQAVQLAEQVVVRVPDFAWGHSILANALEWQILLLHPGGTELQKVRARQRVEAERALALDPKDAMSYFALSGLATSSQEFESIILKGLSVNPHPTIFVGGLYGREAGLLIGQGRSREALPFWRQAAALDPLSAWESAGLATTLAELGQFPEAVTEFNRCLKLWPNDLDIRIRYLLALTFYGGPKEALAALKDATIRPPTLNQAGQDALRGFVETKTNATSTSRAHAITQIRQAAASGSLPPDTAAPMLAELGNVEAAFEVTANPAHPFLDTRALFIPAAAKMRADARFMKLSARLGKVDYWQASGKWPDFCTEERLSYDCKTEAARAATVR